MAGLFSLFTCCFVVFFHTRYKRLEAEERVVYGTKPGLSSPDTSEQTTSVTSWQQRHTGRCGWAHTCGSLCFWSSHTHMAPLFTLLVFTSVGTIYVYSTHQKHFISSDILKNNSFLWWKGFKFTSPSGLCGSILDSLDLKLFS